jgi:nicotinamidase-related amidase
VADIGLFVCDVQNDLADPKGKVGAGGLAKIVADRNLLANLEKVIKKARENMVAIRAKWGAEFHPDIAPLAGDLVFYKQWINPFFGTSLLEWLRGKGVVNLFIAGTATNLVVESAARYADDAGLAVSVIEDCCASPNPARHEFSVAQMLPVFGRVVASSDIN